MLKNGAYSYTYGCFLLFLLVHSRMLQHVRTERKSIHKVTVGLGKNIISIVTNPLVCLKLMSRRKMKLVLVFWGVSYSDPLWRGSLGVTQTCRLWTWPGLTCIPICTRHLTVGHIFDSITALVLYESQDWKTSVSEDLERLIRLSHLTV